MLAQQLEGVDLSPSEAREARVKLQATGKAKLASLLQVWLVCVYALAVLTAADFTITGYLQYTTEARVHLHTALVHSAGSGVDSGQPHAGRLQCFVHTGREQNPAVSTAHPCDFSTLSAF